MVKIAQCLLTFSRKETLMPTIPEQLKAVYDDMMTRAQTDENFSPIFRENRRQLEKAFSSIIKATEEPSLDADTNDMK